MQLKMSSANFVRASGPQGVKWLMSGLPRHRTGTPSTDSERPLRVPRRGPVSSTLKLLHGDRHLKLPLGDQLWLPRECFYLDSGSGEPNPTKGWRICRKRGLPWAEMPLGEARLYWAYVEWSLVSLCWVMGSYECRGPPLGQNLGPCSNRM